MIVVGWVVVGAIILCVPLVFWGATKVLDPMLDWLDRRRLPDPIVMAIAFWAFAVVVLSALATWMAAVYGAWKFLIGG